MSSNDVMCPGSGERHVPHDQRKLEVEPSEDHGDISKTIPTMQRKLPENERRKSVIGKLEEHLHGRIALDLENACFEKIDRSYISKARELISNLGDNKKLRDAVNQDHLSVKRLCAMTADELASRELASLRNRQRTENMDLIVVTDKQTDFLEAARTHPERSFIMLEPKEDEDQDDAFDIRIAPIDVPQKDESIDVNEGSVLDDEPSLPEDTDDDGGNFGEKGKFVVSDVPASASSASVLLAEPMSLVVHSELETQVPSQSLRRLSSHVEHIDVGSLVGVPLPSGVQVKAVARPLEEGPSPSSAQSISASQVGESADHRVEMSISASQAARNSLPLPDGLSQFRNETAAFPPQSTDAFAAGSEVEGPSPSGVQNMTADYQVDESVSRVEMGISASQNEHASLLLPNHVSQVPLLPIARRKSIDTPVKWRGFLNLPNLKDRFRVLARRVYGIQSICDKVVFPPDLEVSGRLPPPKVMGFIGDIVETNRDIAMDMISKHRNIALFELELDVPPGHERFEHDCKVCEQFSERFKVRDRIAVIDQPDMGYVLYIVNAASADKTWQSLIWRAFGEKNYLPPVGVKFFVIAVVQGERQAARRRSFSLAKSVTAGLPCKSPKRGRSPPRASNSIRERHSPSRKTSQERCSQRRRRSMSPARASKTSREHRSPSRRRRVSPTRASKTSRERRSRSRRRSVSPSRASKTSREHRSPSRRRRVSPTRASKTSRERRSPSRRRSVSPPRASKTSREHRSPSRRRPVSPPRASKTSRERRSSFCRRSMSPARASKISREHRSPSRRRPVSPSRASISSRARRSGSPPRRRMTKSHSRDRIHHQSVSPARASRSRRRALSKNRHSLSRSRSNPRRSFSCRRSASPVRVSKPSKRLRSVSWPRGSNNLSRSSSRSMKRLRSKERNLSHRLSRFQSLSPKRRRSPQRASRSRSMSSRSKDRSRSVQRRRVNSKERSSSPRRYRSRIKGKPLSPRSSHSRSRFRSPSVQRRRLRSKSRSSSSRLFRSRSKARSPSVQRRHLRSKDRSSYPLGKRRPLSRSRSRSRSLSRRLPRLQSPSAPKRRRSPQRASRSRSPRASNRSSSGLHSPPRIRCRSKSRSQLISRRRSRSRRRFSPVLRTGSPTPTIRGPCPW